MINRDTFKDIAISMGTVFICIAAFTGLVWWVAYERAQKTAICIMPSGEELRGYNRWNLRDSDGFHVPYQTDFRCKSVRIDG